MDELMVTDLSACMGESNERARGLRGGARSTMHCSQKQSISVETPRDDKTIILLGAAFYSSVSSSINLDRLSTIIDGGCPLTSRYFWPRQCLANHMP